MPTRSVIVWPGCAVRIAERKAVVTTPAKPQWHHAAGAIHGSSYFKMLDDACWFAAQSVERKQFLVTTSFTTYITKPVVAAEGTHLIATGLVTSVSRSLLLAEAVMTLEDGTEVAVVGREHHLDGVIVRGSALVNRARAESILLFCAGLAVGLVSRRGWRGICILDLL